MTRKNLYSNLQPDCECSMPRWAGASLLTICLLSMLFVPLLANEAAASETMLLAEGFEDGWSNDWLLHDDNSANGADFWGPSSYRSHQGANSAWCAEVGNSSTNALPNHDNHFYDQGMISVMEIRLGDISGYDRVEISFFYWAETGTININDYCCCLGGNESGWQVLWKQAEPRVSSWQEIHLELDRHLTDVSFTFVSDDILGLGPYEGVYIDDISIRATDTHPPETRALSLAAIMNTSSFYISYQATDWGSGLGAVMLYYRSDPIDDFILYAPPFNPSGEWTGGAVLFSAEYANGEGSYQFYTIGKDSLGTMESPPSTPDTSTVIDFSPPTTNCYLTGQAGLDGWYCSPVRVRLAASDEVSGVDSTVYRINGGEWTEYSESVVIFNSGSYLVEFYSTDRGGLQESGENVTFSLDPAPPELALTFSDGNITLQVHDGESGIGQCSYSIDGSQFQECTSPQSARFPMTAAGNHIMVVLVRDVAGNENSTSLSFVIPESGSPSSLDPLLVALLVITMVCVIGAGSLFFLRRRK